MKRKSSLQAPIASLVTLIVERFDPEQVILFGSHARDEAGHDSDVDILVVIPVKTSKREKAIEIGAALRHFDLPKDIIVTTPEEFEWRKEVVGTLERPAFREGTVLYARP